MSRCRHYYTSSITSVGNEMWHAGRNTVRPGAVRWTCRDCAATLPLGPANDTPETAVEVRAAELAQATREEREGRADETWTDDENDGWNYHRQGWMPPADYEAGWLAREIWTDEEDDRD